MFNILLKIFTISRSNLALLLILLGYNFSLISFLLFFGWYKDDDITEECEKFISDSKHKRRNLYQNFKFKIDCIAYPIISILYSLARGIEIINATITTMVFIIVYEFLRVAIRMLIEKICKYIDDMQKDKTKDKNSKDKSQKKKIQSEKALNYNVICRFIIKNIIIILLLIFAVYVSTMPNIEITDNNPFILSCISSLFIWGIVEYMSFRFDVIRDVIKERDDFIFTIYEKYYFDNGIKRNVVNRKSNRKIDCYNSLLIEVQELSFKYNYYSITSEFYHIFDKFVSDKENLLKGTIKEIYDKNNKRPLEYWYYNIIKNGIFTKIDFTQYNHKICAYVHDGSKELKNLFE